MATITILASTLGQHLKALGLQVATAESCTGGGIAEAITGIAGSSAWFEAGFVTYSNRQKSAMLDVPEALFASVGAVSQAVVEAMALGAKARSGAHFAVAVSGIAGPDGGSAQKPVGTVWFGFVAGDRVLSECKCFAGDRAKVREQSVIYALEKLVELCVAEIAQRG